MAVMIKRMEKTGLIKREQDEKDQRISRIFITDAGKEICSKLKTVHEQIEEEAFRNFTVEEKLLLRRLMMQLRENLEEACGKDKNISFCNHHK